MFIRFVCGAAVAAALGWAAANYRTQQPRSGDEVTRAAGAGVKSKTAAQVKPQTVASAVTTREGAKTDPRNANEANRRLMEASEGDRRKLLQSTLSRAGKSCAGVTRTFYQGSAKSSSTAFWNVTCREGQSYLVLVNADAQGSKVATCSQFRAAAVIECYKRY